MNDLKHCKHCQKDLELCHFNINCGYYRPNCKSCQKEIAKTYRDIYKQTNYYKDYRKQNRIKLNNYDKQYRLKNGITKVVVKPTIKISKREYYRIYQRIRRQNDPLFKLTGNIRNLIKNSFRTKSIKKNSKTINILNCSFEQFKEHLASKFTSEMNWQNQGSYWVLDHIKPVSVASNEQELIELNHYTNFQPLEKIENLKKYNKQV